LDNFIFYNPTRIIFGKDTVGQIGGVVKEAGGKRLLLVAGGGSIEDNGMPQSWLRITMRSQVQLGNENNENKAGRGRASPVNFYDNFVRSLAGAGWGSYLSSIGLSRPGGGKCRLISPRRSDGYETHA
jgi:hypothetical protein